MGLSAMGQFLAVGLAHGQKLRTCLSIKASVVGVHEGGVRVEQGIDSVIGKRHVLGAFSFLS
jgi:hypothetical protein